MTRCLSEAQLRSLFDNGGMALLAVKEIDQACSMMSCQINLWVIMHVNMRIIRKTLM